MHVGDRAFTERKVAGSVLLSKIRLAALERNARERKIGSIGGFDLVCAVDRSPNGAGQGTSLY